MENFRVVYWCIVAAIILEALSPVPFVLTLGALYIMIGKPRWFELFVRQLYSSDGADGQE